jgi:hypothetical protein
MRKKNYPAVEVIWEDSCSDSGWQTTDQIDRGPYYATTRGSLIHRDEKRVIVALTVTSEETKQDHCSDRITIPMGCVKRIRRLK